MFEKQFWQLPAKRKALKTEKTFIDSYAMRYALFH
jgi:hypothetical protein